MTIEQIKQEITSSIRRNENEALRLQDIIESEKSESIINIYKCEIYGTKIGNVELRGVLNLLDLLQP